MISAVSSRMSVTPPASKLSMGARFRFGRWFLERMGLALSDMFYKLLRCDSKYGSDLIG